MYVNCKGSKDQGGFHDFVEILKLYDKNDDNTMLSHELFRLLTNLGEKLTKDEAKSLMKELCDPADDRIHAFHPIPGEDVRRREVNFCTSRHPESSFYLIVTFHQTEVIVDHCYQLAGLTDATLPGQI